MDLRALALKGIEKAHDRYRSDIESMSEEQLSAKHGGARSAYDFTYEVAAVNHRVAKRIRGEEPGAVPEGWMTAPVEFKSKEACVRALGESVADLKNSLESHSDLSSAITIPDGETTVFELANFMTVHMTYHDAQLNFMQAMAGDGKVHW